jgi:TolB-like protein
VSAELRAVGAILDVRSEVADEQAVVTRTAQSRRTVITLITTLAIAAVIGAGAWAMRATIQKRARHLMAPTPAPLVAVGPLTSSPQWFADGLTADLVTRLGQTPGMKVLSAGQKAPAVLSGTVRSAGGRVTLSLRLHDVAEDEDLWSGQFDGDVSDIFAMQVRIAGDVARALKLPAQSTAWSTRTSLRKVEPTAYESYLRGRVAAERDPARAAKEFEQAIAVDNGLVEALAGLSLALRAAKPERRPRDEGLQAAQVKALAQRAIELDPDLPDANLALALVIGDADAANALLTHALAVDPSYAPAQRALDAFTKR